MYVTVPERQREKTKRETEDGEERARRTESKDAVHGKTGENPRSLTLKGNIGHVPTALNGLRVSAVSRRAEVTRN